MELLPLFFISNWEVVLQAKNHCDIFGARWFVVLDWGPKIGLRDTLGFLKRPKLAEPSRKGIRTSLEKVFSSDLKISCLTATHLLCQKPNIVKIEKAMIS